MGAATEGERRREESDGDEDRRGAGAMRGRDRRRGEERRGGKGRRGGRGAMKKAGGRCGHGEESDAEGIGSYKGRAGTMPGVGA